MSDFSISYVYSCLLYTSGKMISPQSIAIATAACDMEGQDGEILRSVIPYALLYIVLGGLMVHFGC